MLDAPKTCSAPPSASSPVKVTFSNGNEHGSVATLSCESGYTSSGDTTVTCDASTDGTPWPTATPPSCVTGPSLYDCAQDTTDSTTCGCFDQWTFEGCMAEALEADWGGNNKYYAYGDGSTGAATYPIKFLNMEYYANHAAYTASNPGCWQLLVDEEILGSAEYPNFGALTQDNLCLKDGTKGSCYAFAEAISSCAVAARCQLDCHSHRWIAQSMATYIAESKDKCISANGYSRFEPSGKVFANTALSNWGAQTDFGVAPSVSFTNEFCTPYGAARTQQRLGSISYLEHCAPNGKQGVNYLSCDLANPTGATCCDRRSPTNCACAPFYSCPAGPKAAVGGKTGCGEATPVSIGNKAYPACVHTCLDGYTPNTFSAPSAGILHPGERASAYESASYLFCGLAVWTDPAVSVGDGGTGYPEDRTPRWVGGGVPTCTGTRIGGCVCIVFCGCVCGACSLVGLHLLLLDVTRCFCLGWIRSAGAFVHMYVCV